MGSAQRYDEYIHIYVCNVSADGLALKPCLLPVKLSRASLLLLCCNTHSVLICNMSARFVTGNWHMRSMRINDQSAQKHVSNLTCLIMKYGCAAHPCFYPCAKRCECVCAHHLHTICFNAKWCKTTINTRCPALNLVRGSQWGWSARSSNSIKFVGVIARHTRYSIVSGHDEERAVAYMQRIYAAFQEVSVGYTPAHYHRTIHKYTWQTP